tara:strand:+ start:69 stop:656 length:588 start_codon:yes stop_codon:yes gene_type:complete
MNLEIHKSSWFSSDVFSTVLDKAYCDEINSIVEKEQDQWKKGLKSIKAKTSGFDGLRYPIVQEVANFACSKLLPAIGETKKWKYNKWETNEAWINFYQKGDSANLHQHFFSDYCGIFITKSSASTLRFVTPLSIHGYYKSKFETEKYAELIKEKEGLFILFPSYLFHEVSECQSGRISVAFNFENDLISHLNQQK